MAKYAATTTVSTERTLTEIKTALKRYGADGFASGEDTIARALRMVIEWTNPETTIRMVSGEARD
jgi:hypothetical protein